MFCSRTVLRKQDAVGAYIWASIKKLIGGAEILCVFGGQIGKVKGEGVKSDYRFKGLIT